MNNIAKDLWLLSYPMKVMGAELRRNVTVIRLASLDLVIHSTGPFAPEEAAMITGLGRPGWLLDAMLRHDTFSRDGRNAFPDIPFLAPEGFSEQVDFPTQPILPAPVEWIDDLDVIEVQGAPTLREHVFFHFPTRTLIVADLVFNFGSHEAAWTELMLIAAVGTEHHPGMSRPFRMAVQDEKAFKLSMARMLEWDFDRVIVGHGDIIESDGKAKVCAMLDHAGF